MTNKRFFAPVLLSLGLLASSVSVLTTQGAVAEAASLPKCPLSALNNVTAPVQIDFWESMPQANATEIAALTDQFNASQKKVHVNLVQQGTYDETWAKWQAGLTTGQLPAMAMIEDVYQQGIVDSRSILPVQSCENAAKFSTAKFLPRILAYFKINGIQQGLPFNISTPVLYYNKQAFQKAGITAIPTTLAQVSAAAKKLKAAGLGAFALKLDPWYEETWLATSNQLLVNNNNGRTGRASAGTFNNSANVGLYSTLNAMVKSGLASTNPYLGSSAYDNLLGIGSGKYSMTIDTSAALGTISSVLSSGQYPDVTLGVAQFPSLTSSPKGAIEAGGAALYISKKAPAVQQAAAWTFMAFLDSAQSQADWAVNTGYMPIRTDAAALPTVTSYWAANPGYAISYNSMKQGPTTYASTGAAIGPFGPVNNAIVTSLTSMFTGGAKPKTAVNSANSSISQILQSYNSRVG